MRNEWKKRKTTLILEPFPFVDHTSNWAQIPETMCSYACWTSLQRPTTPSDGCRACLNPGRRYWNFSHQTAVWLWDGMWHFWTMSINSWCLIQTIRYLTQNLTRLLRTDEGKFDMCCRHHQPQHVKRSLNILSVPPAKLWYGFQPHVWNRDANIFCANTWMDQQICLDLAGSTLLL